MIRVFLTGMLILIFQYVHSQEHPAYWFSDMDEAKSYSASHQVPILMVFAGSDWCKPCIMFKKDILTSETFDAYAKEHLAVLYLDFPIKKANKLSEEETAHNEALAEKYNRAGAFPAIMMVTKDEEMLGPLQFHNQSPDEFITSCKALVQ